MSDIAFLPARRLAGMIRTGKIGCLELLEHYLGRVEKYNPALNAIIVTDIPKARRRARAADRALAKGELWGPLHGVPMTVKEAFDVAGLPTTWGVPDYKDNIARANAVTATFDAVLMPTTATIAPPIATLEASDRVYLEANLMMLRNTFCANFLDRPALTIPMHGPHDAPPSGLMLMGEPAGDARLIRAGLAVESALRT